MKKQIDVWIHNNQQLMGLYTHIADELPGGTDQMTARKQAIYHKGAYEQSLKFKQLAEQRGLYHDNCDHDFAMHEQLNDENTCSKCGMTPRQAFMPEAQKETLRILPADESERPA
jgi:hypothetical protein